MKARPYKRGMPNVAKNVRRRSSTAQTVRDRAPGLTIGKKPSFDAVCARTGSTTCDRFHSRARARSFFDLMQHFDILRRWIALLGGQWQRATILLLEARMAAFRFTRVRQESGAPQAITCKADTERSPAFYRRIPSAVCGGRSAVLQSALTISRGCQRVPRRTEDAEHREVNVKGEDAIVKATADWPHPTTRTTAVESRLDQIAEHEACSSPSRESRDSP